MDVAHRIEQYWAEFRDNATQKFELAVKVKFLRNILMEKKSEIVQLK